MEAVYDETSPLYDLESDAAISILLEQGAALGAAIIFSRQSAAKYAADVMRSLKLKKPRLKRTVV